MLTISKKMLFTSKTFKSLTRIKNIKLNRLISTLTFLETDKKGHINTSSLHLLQAAKAVGNPIIGLLVGSHGRSAANILVNSVNCPELKHIIVVEDKLYDNYLPEPTSKLIQTILKEFKSEISHLLVASNYIGQNVLPRVSANSNIQPITNVVEIKDFETFVRPIQAGNLLTTIRSGEKQKMLTIRTAFFDKINPGKTSSVNIEIKKYTLGLEPKEIVELESTQTARDNNTKFPDLTSAKIVVAGGNGFKNKENFEKLIYPLAKQINASVGATRAAVDNEFCDNSLQIGQTGKSVAPDIYIGIGISGAIQHLAGMKDSSTIVVINNDRDAPLVKLADYSLNGDLFQIIPEIIKKLS